MSGAFWCYSAKLEEKQATYQGVPMSWEQWSIAIRAVLDMHRAMGNDTKTATAAAMSKLYYQNGHYLTFPQNERKAIVPWMYQYLKDGVTPFLLQGDMESEEYTFTIDFDRDTALKENVAIGEDMAAYNRKQNAAKKRPAAHRKTFCHGTGGRVDNGPAPGPGLFQKQYQDL